MRDDDILMVISDIEDNNNNYSWQRALAALPVIFNPSLPVHEGRLFVGRIKQITKIISVVFSGGEHGILYGERGVGKTSLANIIKEKVSNSFKNTKFIKINCSEGDSFFSIWANALDGFESDGVQASTLLNEATRPFSVYKILEGLQKLQKYVFIFDEFDRITDPKVNGMMADTIKYFSDNPINITILIVGVGFSIEELFGNHPSIQRCCAQIPMPRMSNTELREILEERAATIKISIKEKVIGNIITIAQGFPGHVHLLGRESFLAALVRKSRIVEEQDFDAAIDAAVERAHHSLIKEYNEAVYSTNPKNIYQQVLLACAMAPQNEVGKFCAADIRVPLSKIIKKTTDISNYARHLSNFCKDKHGPVLSKSEGKGRVQYNFRNPMLPAYIKIMGKKNGLI